MDCPYYEQLQYVGDTRLQALLSYVTTGDTRLGARAVRLFDWSRMPDGLTQSRYPSRMEQIIPPFSLIWVLMVEDLWRYAPERGGDGRRLPAGLPGRPGMVRAAPDARRRDRRRTCPGGTSWTGPPDGARRWTDGSTTASRRPPRTACPRRPSTCNTWPPCRPTCACTSGLGDTRESEFWQAEADMLADAILLTFWDPDARLLREGPTDEWGYTQHAQAWGILTGRHPRRRLGRRGGQPAHRRDADPDDLLPHVLRRRSPGESGPLGAALGHWLAPWRAALDLHLTTWPEQPEPTRSDCHAWSAWPTYCFLTHVLGVRRASLARGSSLSRPSGWRAGTRSQGRWRRRAGCCTCRWTGQRAAASRR